MLFGAAVSMAGVVVAGQVWERSCRVIVSIAWRPRCVASMRACVSAVRFITVSSTAKTASRTIMLTNIVTSSSGSVKPPSERARASHHAPQPGRTGAGQALPPHVAVCAEAAPTSITT